MAADDLFDLCGEFLDACVEALATTMGGAPGLQFVSPGPPAWDCCDAIIVYAGGPLVAETSPGSPVLAPGHRVQAYGVVNLITMTATALRCVPTLDDDGNPPTAAAMTLAAAVTNADCWAITNYCRSKQRAGLLFAPKEREVFWRPAVAVGQQGGCGGWALTVDVQLDGYRVTFP